MTDTLALGQPEQQALTTEREAGTHFPTAVTDALGRRTAYAYDDQRNVTAVTRRPGTGDAVTTSYTFESTREAGRPGRV